MHLQDQFEWDIQNDPNVYPDLFARVLAADLGLNRELQVAIAHSIRQQIAEYVTTPHLKLPVIEEAIRAPSVREDFTPHLLMKSNK